MKSTAISKRKKARQTRLNFTPVASSSPAAAHLSPQVRDRAAAVSYDGSPSPMKKRKVERREGGEVEDITDSFKALPTPDKSSQSRTSRSEQLRRQLDFGDSGNNSSLRGGGDKMGNLQSRLSAPGVFESSSEDEAELARDSSSSDYEGPQSKPVRAAGRQTTISRSTKPVPFPISDDDDTPKEITTRGRTAGTVSKANPPKVPGPPKSLSSPLRRSVRSTRNQRSIAISSDESSGSECSDAVKSRRSAKKPAVITVETESSSDEMPDTSPMRKPRRAVAANNRARRRSPSFEVPDDVVESDEDEDDEPVTPRKRSRRSQSQVSANGSDDSVLTSPRKRLRRPQPAQLQISSDEEEEDDEEIVSTQRKRRLKAPDTSINQQEKEDLDEDLKWLGSSPKLSSKTRGKLATPKKNARQSALEELRRKRAGETAETSSRSNRKRLPLRRIDDDDDDDDVSSEEEAEEDDGLQDLESGGPLHRSDVLDMFYEDDDDDGFVVDEDDNGDDTIGAPDVQLPLQFSGFSSSKAKDLFKHAIDWMVQKKINPGFERDDPVYRITFQKLDDEVKGLAGSKFESSVWRPDFTKAIKARPDINIMDLRGLSAVLDKHCQACNRQNHPATFNVQLSGKPYHSESLELVAESDDDSEDVDEDEDGEKQ